MKPRRSAPATVLATLSLALGLVSALVLAPAANAGSGARPSSPVASIDWWKFDSGAPEGERAATSRAILLNTNRYALMTWFPERFGDQTGRYLDLGAGEELRQGASVAFALAAALTTGAYDPATVGFSRHAGEAVVKRLATSLAHHHGANEDGGWGYEWQSALWAYYGGFAAWLVWDELAPEDRVNVRRMIEAEADRFLHYDVPYYRDRSGKVIYAGDSKAEENAWNANLLQLATAMMPRHAHGKAWMERNLELMVSAFSRPSDAASDEIVNGRRLSAWLNGSNIAEDGTLVNHGFIHPDYMGTVLHNTNATLAYGLARVPTPSAALHNADVVYDALVDLEFPSPPFRAPGGTVYVDGSPNIYYPQGNDWGTHRRMHFALLDAHADLFGFDDAASTPGSEWEGLHAGMVLEMQSRFADGRTYGPTSEDTYSGREQWVAAHAAQAWLAHWLAAQDAVSITNRPYVAGRVDLEAPRYLTRGEAATVSATFHADALGPASDVELELETPPGWTVTAETATTAHRVPADGTFVARWRVEPSPEAELDDEVLTTEARWGALGRRWSSDGVGTTRVLAALSGSVHLSDVEWVEARVGYPRDGSGTPLRDQNFYGDKISIQGTVFDHGLFAHAASSIVFHLGGGCSRLTAVAGIDDSLGSAGSAVFQVWGDDTKLYDSGLITGATAAPPIEVDLTGTRDLDLVATDGGNGIGSDHAVWGDPLVTCAS